MNSSEDSSRVDEARTQVTATELRDRPEDCIAAVSGNRIEDDNEAQALRLEAALEAGDAAVIDELCDRDVVDHNPLPGQRPGSSGLSHKAEAFRRAFPDLRRMVDFTVVEGNLVVTRWTIAGTHSDEFLGMPVTGNRISLTGISIYRFDAGRVVEHWSEFNGLGLVAQLRAFPLTEPPPDSPAPLA